MRKYKLALQMFAILAFSAACSVYIAEAQSQAPLTFPSNDVTHMVQSNGLTHIFNPLTATGPTAAFQALTAWHAYMLVVTGAPSTCKFYLQGSIDGVNWNSLDGTSVTCTATAYFVVGGGTSPYPTAFVRGNLQTLTGGSSPTVTLQYAGR